MQYSYFYLNFRSPILYSVRPGENLCPGETLLSGILSAALGASVGPDVSRAFDDYCAEPGVDQSKIVTINLHANSLRWLTFDRGGCGTRRPPPSLLDARRRAATADGSLFFGAPTEDVGRLLRYRRALTSALVFSCDRARGRRASRVLRRHFCRWKKMSDDVGAARAVAQEAIETVQILNGEALPGGATKKWEERHRAEQKTRAEAEERAVRAEEENMALKRTFRDGCMPVGVPAGFVKVSF